jgi:peptidoglycan/LPS O-acetylase OafA/YrhL
LTDLPKIIKHNSGKKISTIDGLRGLAALWVIIAHCAIWGGYTGHILNPKVAVDIFMAVSGFVMMYTTDLIHKKESFKNKKNWIKFYIRRFFRIAPAYYVELISALCLSSYFVSSYHELGRLNNNQYLTSISADFSLQNILLHITFVFGLIPEKAFSTMLPDWSLGLEVQFYLIFPAIFLFVNKSPNLNKLTVFLVAVTGISVLSKVYFIPYFGEPSLILYQLPVFLIGIFIYCGTKPSDGRSNKRNFIYLLYGLLLNIYVIFTKTGGDEFYLLLASILLVLSRLDNFYGRKINIFFDNFLFATLSDLSYSAYLFHGFFLSMLGAYIERNLYPIGYTSTQCIFIILITIIPLTYVTSYFSHRYIELPGIAFGKALIKKFS